MFRTLSPGYQCFWLQRRLKVWGILFFSASIDCACKQSEASAICVVVSLVLFISHHTACHDMPQEFKVCCYPFIAFVVALCMQCSEYIDVQTLNRWPNVDVFSYLIACTAHTKQLAVRFLYGVATTALCLIVCQLQQVRLCSCLGFVHNSACLS